MTPPRSAELAQRAATATHILPPVRTPAPRTQLVATRAEPREAERPVLLLVADASDQFDIALRTESAAESAVASATGQLATEHPGRRLSTAFLVAAAIAASIVVVVVAALVTSQITAAPSFTPMPKAATKTTTTTAATMTVATTGATTNAATRSPAAVAPAIPVVDVKSLPPAPSR